VALDVTQRFSTVELNNASIDCLPTNHSRAGAGKCPAAFCLRSRRAAFRRLSNGCAIRTNRWRDCSHMPAARAHARSRVVSETAAVVSRCRSTGDVSSRADRSAFQTAPAPRPRNARPAALRTAGHRAPADVQRHALRARQAGSESPLLTVGPIIDVRIHGFGAKHGGSYPDEVLEEWADWLRRGLACGRNAYVYFNNNDINGYTAVRRRAIAVARGGELAWTPADGETRAATERSGLSAVSSQAAR